MAGYILRYDPSKPDAPVLIDVDTDKPVERHISKIKVELEAGKMAKAVVECIDVGLEMVLGEDQVEFKSQNSVVLDQDQRTHLIASLRALKIISRGGDVRSAMIEVMRTLNEAGIDLLSPTEIDLLAANIDPEKPVEPAKLEAPDEFKDVTSTETAPKEPKASSETPLPPGVAMPTTPTGNAETKTEDYNDPLKGAGGGSLPANP